MIKMKVYGWLGMTRTAFWCLLEKTLLCIVATLDGSWEGLLAAGSGSVSMILNLVGHTIFLAVLGAYWYSVGFPDYWLSGTMPSCPRVDCGVPPPTPGAEYGQFLDTRYQSSFFFGCQNTFKLAGQSSKHDNVVRLVFSNLIYMKTYWLVNQMSS